MCKFFIGYSKIKKKYDDRARNGDLQKTERDCVEDKCEHSSKRPTDNGHCGLVHLKKDWDNLCKDSKKLLEDQKKVYGNYSCKC